MTGHSRDRSPAPRGANPFGRVGSPIKGLIAPEDLEKKLTDEVLDELTGIAQISDGNFVPARKSRSRRAWFAMGVKKIVKGWLESAHRPAVRKVADEFRRLHGRLFEAWKAPPPEARAAA